MKYSASFLLTLLIAPFLVCFLFIYPVFDEYWYAYIVKRDGFWDAQVWFYTSCTGRFVSTFLGTFNLFLCKNVWLYRIFNAGIFILFLYSLYSLIKYSVGYFGKDIKSYSLWIFFLVLTFFLNRLPGFSEFTYWLMGSLTYSLGLTFLNFFIIYLFFKNNISIKNRYAGLIFFALMTFGTSEFAAITLLMAFGIHFVAKFISKRQSLLKIIQSTEFFIFIALSIFYFLIVLKAPGSAERFAVTKKQFPFAGNIIYALKSGLLGGTKFIYNVISFRNGWLLFGLTFLLMKLVNSSTDLFTSKIKNKKNVMLIWAIIQITLIVFSFFVAISYTYSSGIETMIPRVISIPYYLWIVDMCASGILFACIILPELALRSIHRYTIMTSCFILFGLSFYFGSVHSVQRVYADLISGEVNECKKYYQEQYNLFTNCKNDDVRNLTLKSKPITYVWDLSEKKYQTRYFGYYQSVLCGNTEGILILDR